MGNADLLANLTGYNLTDTSPRIDKVLDLRHTFGGPEGPADFFCVQRLRIGLRCRSAATEVPSVQHPYGLPVAPSHRSVARTSQISGDSRRGP